MSVSLTFATWNFGPGSTEDLTGLMIWASIIGVQEAGDRKRPIAAALREMGWKQITGTEAGQASTPLLYDPEELELLKVSRVLLAHEQYIGEGAGPSTLKEKWLIGGLFKDRLTGRIFWAFCVHYVATQGKPLRRRVAMATSNRILMHVRSLRRAVFVMGDFNAESTSSVLKVLHSVLLDAQVLMPQDTHGKRSIDNLLWTPRHWMTLDHTRTQETGSDHRAFFATFMIRPRPNHPKEIA